MAVTMTARRGRRATRTELATVDENALTIGRQLNQAMYLVHELEVLSGRLNDAAEEATARMAYHEEDDQDHE